MQMFILCMYTHICKYMQCAHTHTYYIEIYFQNDAMVVVIQVLHEPLPQMRAKCFVSQSPYN